MFEWLCARKKAKQRPNQDIVERIKLSGQRQKLVDIVTVLPIVARLREEEIPIIFTNGVFDLLHAGHILCLTQAKWKFASVGALFVALNTDESVKVLKGPARPIQNFNTRCRRLESLECVDFVIPLADKTPIQLIHTIKPDILVKGGDYSTEQIVGGEDVRSWGGQVYVTDKLQGESTTQIINQGLRRPPSKDIPLFQDPQSTLTLKDCCYFSLETDV